MVQTTKVLAGEKQKRSWGQSKQDITVDYEVDLEGFRYETRLEENWMEKQLEQRHGKWNITFWYVSPLLLFSLQVMSDSFATP